MRNVILMYVLMYDLVFTPDLHYRRRTVCMQGTVVGRVGFNTGSFAGFAFLFGAALFLGTYQDHHPNPTRVRCYDICILLPIVLLTDYRRA